MWTQSERESESERTDTSLELHLFITRNLAVIVFFKLYMPNLTVEMLFSHPLNDPPSVLVSLRRDVGYRWRHFSGTLEAAVVGKRNAVLPRVHDRVWASASDDAAHSPGARTRPPRAHASAAHLSYGKLSRLIWNNCGFGHIVQKQFLKALLWLEWLSFSPCVIHSVMCNCS